MALGPSRVSPLTGRSRGVVQIQAKLTFEPEKINIFNKDCRRGGKEVTCMSVIVCLSLDFRTRTRTKSGADVGKPGTSLHMPRVSVVIWSVRIQGAA